MTLPLPSSIAIRWEPVRSPSFKLLIALLLFFVSAPFVQGVRHGRLVEALLLTLVLVSAVFATGTRGHALWMGAILSAVTLGIRWVHYLFPAALPVWAFPIVAIVFLGYVVRQLLRFVLDAPEVNSEVLCASLAVYLILGLVFAVNYILIGDVSPESFSFTTGPAAERKMDNFNAFYFSFTVLSTVGFGDITPVSRPARMLAVIEAVTGMFYVTVLIARLVSMYAPASGQQIHRIKKQL